MAVNLTNFDENAKSIKLTPRSLAACKSNGLRVKDLLQKKPEDFQEKTLPEDIANEAYCNHESRRKGRTIEKETNATVR